MPHERQTETGMTVAKPTNAGGEERGLVATLQVTKNYG